MKDFNYGTTRIISEPLSKNDRKILSNTGQVTDKIKDFADGQQQEFICRRNQSLRSRMAWLVQLLPEIQLLPDCSHYRRNGWFQSILQ